MESGEEGGKTLEKDCFQKGQTHQRKEKQRDFPGSPVVKTLPSNEEDAGLIPGQGAKIQHAAQYVGTARTVHPPLHQKNQY